MNALHLSDQQLSGSAQPEFLHFFRAETRDADFGDPDGQISNAFNFADALRPFVNGPMIPIERKAVQCDYIEMFKQTKASHSLDEIGINRRDTAENAKNMR